MQPLFQQAAGLTLRLLLLIILSLLVMTTDHRFHHVEKVRTAILQGLYPVHYLVNLPADAAAWLLENLSSRDMLTSDNTRLRAENLSLRARQQQFDALANENVRLRKLLRAAAHVEQDVLVAELLAVDLDPYRQQVVIDKGSDDGVYSGQPLLDAQGVMGQVIEVAADSAVALLISDPSHALPVEVLRNGLRAIARGVGRADRIELLHIPASADVEVGDILLSSGLGGRFPPDYPVARVTEVERPRGRAFARVFARPNALLDRSREVLLVWREPRRGATADIPAELVPTAPEYPTPQLPDGDATTAEGRQ